MGQHAIEVIGGYQLQVGSSAQEFGKFLKTLEAAGQGTKTLWAKLVRQVYGKLLIAGNFCSIGIVLWAIGQLGYNGSKIVTALKTQSYQLGLATIIRAFCCGIAAFLLKSKYDKVLVTHARRPPRPDSDKDVEAADSQDDQLDEEWVLPSDDEPRDRKRPC